jgi:N-acetylmuramoyl-L-alanine amidase
MAISMDQVNGKLKSLRQQVDFSVIDAAVKDTSDKYLAAKESTLGSGDVGEKKGGTQSLTQELDNAVDKLESTLKPTIAKITETFEGIKAELTPKITEGVKDDVEVLTKVNALANLNVLGDIVEDTDQIDNFEEMNFDITTDASPEAVTAALKTAVKVTNEKIEDGLKKLANTDFQDIVDQAVKDFTVKADETPKAVKALDTSIKQATSALEKKLGKIGSGSLIKDMIEESSNVLSNAVNTVIRNTSGASGGSNLEFRSAQSIAGKMLRGDFDLAEAEAFDNLTVPDDLKALAEASGITVPTSLTLANATDFNKVLELNPATKNSVAVKEAQVGFKRDLANVQKIVNNPENTTAAAVVKQQDESVPQTSALVARPENARVANGPTPPPNGYGFLNSKEEIIKYLQSATREITTVIWHWTANYNDQYHIGSEEIARVHNNKNLGGIGYHFVIKRDGSLQLGRNVNKTGAHVAGFNTGSIGIAFVAGFNCASNTKNPNKYISAKSITDAQMKTFRTFMDSFYTVFPGGQAWGHVDFPNNKGKVDPGFDVQATCKTMFGKVNIGHPKIDGHCLTVAEIKASKQTAIS